MLKKTSVGWIFALRDDPESMWGSVDRFYEDVLSGIGSKKQFVIKSETWGKLQRKDYCPRKGDGFAFYHSTRAIFPENDHFKKRPRISLVGELVNIERDGQNVNYIEVKIYKSVALALKNAPIIRDENTKRFFEQSGIIPGAVATYYQADRSAWRNLLKYLNSRIALD